jgi:hypothetical protein
MIDHLQRMFIPEDSIGSDGQVHEERDLRTCACGLAATTALELDAHFMLVFTPPDAIGHDGKRHQALVHDF